MHHIIQEHGITSDEALVLDNLPRRTITIVGGGYIAVEFTGIFNGLGYDVHLMYRASNPLRAFDEECRTVVGENLRKRGVTVHSECTPLSLVQQADGSKVLNYKNKHGEEGSIVSDQVMFATGRKPSTSDMGLEDAGVKLDPKSKAICVDAYSKTSVPSIWAVGDVTDRMALTPVALMEGKALAATLFGGKPSKPDYNNIPTAVFAQPPLGTVGLTEEQAVAKLSGEIDVYVSRFRPMKNTLSGRDERTFMKMLVCVGSDRVVGCHMVGPDAPEIMQGLGVALRCGATKAQFDATVGIHPSAAEEWVTMAGAARRIVGKGDAECAANDECAGYKD
jgi:glutathione reductase (NADPH)